MRSELDCLFSFANRCMHHDVRQLKLRHPHFDLIPSIREHDEWIERRRSLFRFPTKEPVDALFEMKSERKEN